MCEITAAFFQRTMLHALTGLVFRYPYLVKVYSELIMAKKSASETSHTRDCSLGRFANLRSFQNRRVERAFSCVAAVYVSILLDTFLGCYGLGWAAIIPVLTIMNS